MSFNHIIIIHSSHRSLSSHTFWWKKNVHMIGWQATTVLINHDVLFQILGDIPRVKITYVALETFYAVIHMLGPSRSKWITGKAFPIRSMFLLEIALKCLVYLQLNFWTYINYDKYPRLWTFFTNLFNEIILLYL